MAHAEPKITIDLSEYNELQEIKKQITGDEAANLHKLAMAAFLSCGGNVQKASILLHEFGIHFSINTVMSNARPPHGLQIDPDSIIIYKEKK